MSADLRNIGTGPAQGAKALGPIASERSRASERAGGPSFRDTLLGNLSGDAGSQTAGIAKKEGLRFSNHAVERMQSRGIFFNNEMLQRIESAVQKAAQKGARETLVLTDETAMIVAVKDNTVVTVMDKAALKENVFTNIDSTVVL